MPRRKPQISIANYGQYTAWNKTSREMPKLIKYTTTIEAVEGNEFGIIINVDFLKGEILNFIIKHPPIKDGKGNFLPQFKGELHVNSVHTQFFIGDGIWLPVEDKIGDWEVIILHNNKKVVSKSFKISACNT